MERERGTAGASSNTGAGDSSSGGAPAVGKSTRSGGGAVDGGSAVDGALATAGHGEAHASGAIIHNDGAAHAAAAELGAAAFTAGNDVFFGADQYAPGSPEGDALMRHELAHVDQTRGLAPPAPGNFKVSDPHGSAETAAAAAEDGVGGGGGGAAAEAGTIHRAPDKLEEFFAALAGNDAAGAKTKWGKLSAADKARMRSKKVKTYPAGLKGDPIESVLEVMGKDGLPIMKETKAAFDKLKYADAVLDDKTHDAAYWMPALRGEGLFDAWINKLPERRALTEGRLKKLDPWMTQATTLADIKQIFEQAYPRLRDASYGASFLKAAKWTGDDVKRMWEALQGKVPLAHAQTIAGGFNLGTHHKLAPAKTWKALGFGWHDSASNVIVMPKSSSTATGGGTGHDMTGGTSSGVVPAGTKADPTLTHWDGTMLHEIGHGVGQKTDGNKFAKTHGDWKGNLGWDAWSKHLFDDAAAKAALPKPPPKQVLAPAEARHFLSAEIAGTSYVPAKWKKADVVTFIETHYKDEKLVKYWKNVKGGTDAYKVDANNHDGGRTYVWLERGGLEYTSYKKEISDNKVSWYSLSSTVEWFAEQYANYYRTGKAGTGADADTKKKLDAIDKMDATKTGGLSKAAPGGAAAAPGGEAAPAGEAEATPGDEARAPVTHAEDAGGKGGAPPVAAAGAEDESLSANIHRMNFD